MKKHLKKILAALGLTIAIAYAATDATTVRHLTGQTVAYVVWELPNGTTQRVNMVDRDFSNPAPPQRGSIFVMGASGIPAYDTADGFLHNGDVYDVDGKTIKYSDSNLDFFYTKDSAHIVKSVKETITTESK